MIWPSVDIDACFTLCVCLQVCTKEDCLERGLQYHHCSVLACSSLAGAASD